MKMKMVWPVALAFVIGTATQRTMAAAEGPPDFEAEKEQMAKEEARQHADRAKGIRVKQHLLFTGTVYLLAQPDEKLRSDVAGYFVTSLGSQKPRRTYQMVLEEPSKDLLDELKKVNGKTVRLRGTLRLFDANGNAKYLFVDSIEQSGPTPKAPVRELPGGV